MLRSRIGIQKKKRACYGTRRPRTQKNAGRCSYDHKGPIRPKSLGFLSKMVVLLMSKPEKNKTKKQTNRTPDTKNSIGSKLATIGGRQVRHMFHTHANFGPTRRRDAYAPCLDRIPRSRLSERGKSIGFLRLSSGSISTLFSG